MRIYDLPLTPIMRSWLRCRERGLPSDLVLPAAPAPGPAAQLLLAQARSSIEDLYQLTERPGFAVLLADAQAVAIDLEGDPELVALARGCGLAPPALLAEEAAGTNAVDLALREALPAQTAGEQHYALCLQPLAFAAAPLFDAAGGPLGALAIVTHARASHPYTIGLAIAAAQALHNQLRAEHLLAEANDQLAELYATLETMSEGLVFVGPGGEIRRINRWAAELLGVSAKAVSGRPLAAAVAAPEPVRRALEARRELQEQELHWQGPAGAAALTAVRPVWNPGRRYLGALVALRPAHAVHRLVQQVVGARARFTFRDIVGQSPAMLDALHQAHLAANGSGGVLLRGEPGVGKEIFAQAIHNGSARAPGPFVGLNCAAVPRPLLAGELFGEEGEARGAAARGAGRPGKIELAHGGTLFLEQVEVLAPELQTALLRAIEMRRIIRSGGSRPLPVDVRIVATAGDEFERHVGEGRFRPDLAARLTVCTVEIPPLRSRADDLLLLVTHLLQQLGERLGRQVALAPEALQALRGYPWPGNVRELELTLERTLAGGEKSVIGLDDLPEAVAQGVMPVELPGAPSLEEHHRLSERDAILRAGRQAGGHIGRTAALLGVSRATLWRKMGRHGLARDDLAPVH
jgi:transcriptional activator for dhaKLM operon